MAQKKTDMLLDVSNLSISVTGRDGDVNVVHDVSFSVRDNESLGIVGESGCGKSISMLALIGLLPHGAKISGGKAMFAGEDLLTASPARLRDLRGNKISFVFQDPMTAFNPVMRIGDQISEVLHHKKRMGKADSHNRAADLLDMVGIPSPRQRINNYPHELSGGMRQRAMIAMALASEPELLIADEPTTALDVTVQAQIVELIKDLKKQSDMAVIWITHDLALVSGVVDKISVFYAGRVIEQAQVDNFFAAPSHPYTRGLLASLPTLEGGRGTELDYIDGSPPDPRRMPPGCAFSPRCDRANKACLQETPPLRSIGLGGAHLASCLYPYDKAEST